jgi:ABC-type dipeptide/oligopeptide/nickel transport system permease component
MRSFRWATGLLLILFLTYTMMFYGGGDPVVRMFLDRDDAAVDAAMLKQIRARYNLDAPLPEQFWNYLTRLGQGDMGNSIREQRPVADMVRATLPISLQLGLAATVLATLVGVPLGVFAALRHNRRADFLIVGGVVISNAVPVFVTGPLLLLLLVVVLNVMDVPWGWSGLFSTKAILPVVVLSTGPLPIIVRQTRAAVLEVMHEDYIRTARAKGLREAQVVMRHMLRPVLTPVVTSVGLVLITLVNGAIFVELIFGIPGFGGLTLQGLQQVDYPIIMATVLIGALIVMVGNFVVDLMYPLLDPRITGRN